MKIILTTCPEKESEILAQKLLEEKLCACISITNAKSLYWWKGKIEKGNEVLLIIKTKDDLADKLMKRIKEIHSYENPEIIVLNVEKAAEKYLKWIDEVTK
ncbi:MAG: divalent-cation tolerance protein CutA [Candidatus Aenigmatarchaeota archaeon]